MSEDVEKPSWLTPALEADIDARLTSAWMILWDSRLMGELDEERQAEVASMVRSAYLCGYRDCVNEVRAGKGAELLSTHNIELI